MTVRNFLNYLSFASIIEIIVLTAIGFYWYYYPYEPLKFIDPEFPILNKEVHQGDMIYYTSRYCKTKDMPFTVTRSFINSIIYVTPATVTNRPMGCPVEVTIGVMVPRELPPGKNYYLQQTYQGQVNPIRTITIKENTEEFEVLEATASAN